MSTKELPGNCSYPYHLKVASKAQTKDAGVLYAFPSEKDHNPYSAAEEEEEEEVLVEEGEKGEYNPYGAVYEQEEYSEGITDSECEISEEQKEANSEDLDSDTGTKSEESIELSASGERDWDTEFQMISAMDPNEIKKHRKMARLADDFQNGMSGNSPMLILSQLLQHTVALLSRREPFQ